MVIRGLLVIWMVVGASAMTGCLSQQPPANPRYFLPELPAATSGTATARRGEIRFGQVTAAPHLGDRMVWRVSDVELMYDEVNRWANEPDVVVRAALFGLMATGRGPRLSESLDAPGLDLSVTAFEGDLKSGQAVVEIVAALGRRARGTVQIRIIRAEHPVEPERPEALARAVGEALKVAAG